MNSYNAQMIYPNPNSFQGSDSERIEQAVMEAKLSGLPIRISPRKVDAISERTYWLLDRAILLPGNCTLILDNCVLKLSDESRDNFIRSANCGYGISDIKELQGIHIVGIGQVELLGADKPRSTGDSAKTLGERTYGTDAGKEGETPNGDWRNIGILMSNVKNFSISNLTIVDSHCWAISLEYCSYGKLENLSFRSTGSKMIDGKNETILNQDGIDLRRGCHDIIIDGVRGYTGDDLVALTSIPTAKPVKAGRYGSTAVSGSEMPGYSNDIYNVIIKNVLGYCAGGHHIVRFLNTRKAKLHNISLDTLVDTSPEGFSCYAAVKIGDSNPAYGGHTELGYTYAITVRNVQSKAKRAIFIGSSLTDSIINSIINQNPEAETIFYGAGKENTRNLIISEIVEMGK